MDPKAEKKTFNFEKIENLDSDGDGVKNIDEIKAGHEPRRPEVQVGVMAYEPVTRRRWIDVLLGTSACRLGGGRVYPVLRYLTPARDGGGSNKATLTDAQKTGARRRRGSSSPAAARTGF